MIELARSKDGLSFHILEHSFELEKLNVGNFTYFQKHLGMTNYMANFKSWLKRPSVILLVAISGKTIVGWCMNERWSSPSKDGKPVHVLRAIEVSPDISRKGYGKSIFHLVSYFIPGHIITKPVNVNAKEFFRSLNFICPDSTSSVSLMDYPGYVILEEAGKSSDFDANIVISKVSFYSGRQKMFPDISAPNVELINSNIDDAMGENIVDDSVADVQTSGKQPCKDGECQGEQKMMSPCKCGSYMASKYLINNKRTGTAYICQSCNEERYFLPLKK
jgi:hypothetical protein